MFLPKAIIFVVLFIPSINLIENVSNVFLEERMYKLQRTPLENFKTTLSSLFKSKKNIKTTGSIVDDLRLRDTAVSENYHSLLLFDRVSLLLVHDNYNSIYKNLSEKQIKTIREYAVGKLISIAPQPIISLFSDKFDKSYYVGNSQGSFIQNTFDPQFGLFHAVVSGAYEAKLLFGNWSIIIYFIYSLIIFVIIDAFYNRKSMIISPLALMFFFLLGGAILNIFATEFLR